ncbi:MAG: hypothetical protein R3B13_28175 [Polyangiaceae bacterium]
MTEGDEGSRDGKWMLSLEGVTHVPVDVGAQAVLELPVGLRVLGGYGVIPSAFIDLVTPSEYNGEQVDTSLYDGGHAWRLGAGLRPSSRIGLYFDAGLVRATLEGSVRQRIGATGAVGDFELTSRLSLWFFEVGYQGHVAPHVVLGVGLGLMGTMDASSDVSATPSSLGSNAQALTDEAANEVDRELESYGVVPTLTLRAGFDLL